MRMHSTTKKKKKREIVQFFFSLLFIRNFAGRRDIFKEMDVPHVYEYVRTQIPMEATQFVCYPFIATE